MYHTFIVYIWLIPLQEEVSLETLLLVLINSRWLSQSHTSGIFLSQDKFFSCLFSCLLSCDYSEFISQHTKWMLHLAVKFFALDWIMTSKHHHIRLVLLSHAVLDDIPSLAVLMVIYQLAQLVLPAGCMLNILSPLLHHKHFWLLTDFDTLSRVFMEFHFKPSCKIFSLLLHLEFLQTYCIFANCSEKLCDSRTTASHSCESKHSSSFKFLLFLFL